MPRITFAVLLIGITRAAAVVAAGPANVLLLLSDDLGSKDIGCYDGPVATPVIDRLAEGGVRFTDFYSGAAVCSPSRATTLTGRQHLRTGVYSWIHDQTQRSHLLESEVTIAEVLRSRGYATAHIGKWHLGLPTRQRKKPTPREHGFEHWFATANNAAPSHRDPTNFLRNGERVGPLKGYSSQLLAEETLRWLTKSENSERPFFLNIWFHEPHDPIAAPEALVRHYGKTNDLAAVYSATIANTDRAIGRIIEGLEKLGKLDNTIVVYSSDNGSYRVERNGFLRGKKGANYEGGIRVPGIISWPGRIRPGQIERSPAGLVDLLPTICGLLGIEKPRGVHLDGSDLSPLLLGKTRSIERHQPLFWLLPLSGPAVAMRKREYSIVAYRDYELPKDRKAMDAVLAELLEKLRSDGQPDLTLAKLREQIFRRTLKNREHERLRGKYVLLNMFQESWIPAIRRGGFTRFELYDLARDPAQRHDLAEERPDVLRELRNELLRVSSSVLSEARDWRANGPD